MNVVLSTMGHQVTAVLNRLTFNQSHCVVSCDKPHATVTSAGESESFYDNCSSKEQVSRYLVTIALVRRIFPFTF